MPCCPSAGPRLCLFACILAARRLQSSMSRVSIQRLECVRFCHACERLACRLFSSTIPTRYRRGRQFCSHPFPLVDGHSWNSQNAMLFYNVENKPCRAVYPACQ
ncbi:hypothetical protein C8Q74DRAFT_1225225, partial [Fomes fomentarius]